MERQILSVRAQVYVNFEYWFSDCTYVQEQRQEDIGQINRIRNKIDDAVITTNSHLLEKNFGTKLTDGIEKNYDTRMHHFPRAMIKRESYREH